MLEAVAAELAQGGARAFELTRRRSPGFPVTICAADFCRPAVYDDVTAIQRRHAVLVWRRFGLILALLGALALGGSGYAVEAGPHADAARDMAQMASHDCCPESDGMMTGADAHLGQPCDGMDGCPDGPCGFAMALSSLVPCQSSADLVIALLERCARPVDIGPVSNGPDNLDRPPRA